MNILCLGSHPDDLEFGAAGTLIKYAKYGHDVYLMLMTKGDVGGKPEVRELEQIESGKIIGVKDIFWGGYRDTKLSVEAQTITEVEKVIKKVQPDVIFCCCGDDTHQDHRILSLVVKSAARNAGNLLFYETPTTQPSFQPNVFVNIEDVLDKKMQTLKAHSSQVLKTNIYGTSVLDMANSSAIFRGLQARVRYAEGFESTRLFLDIK